MPRLSKCPRMCLLVGILIPSAMATCLFLVQRVKPDNKANFAKIGLGMTKKQVRAIVHFPPEDETKSTISWDGPADFLFDLDAPIVDGDVQGFTNVNIWAFDDGIGLVYWGLDDKVMGTMWYDRDPQK